MKILATMMAILLFCLCGCASRASRSSLENLQLHVCGNAVAENVEIGEDFLEKFSETPLGKQLFGVTIVPAVFSLRNEHIRISLYKDSTVSVFKCKKKKNENFQLDSLWQFGRESTDFEKALYARFYETFLANKTPEKLDEIRRGHRF